MFYVRADHQMLEKLIFHLRVDTDGSDENLATALHHVGAGQDHRVDRHPLVHLKPVVSDSSSSHASGNRERWEMVGSRLQGNLSPTFAKKKGQEDISLSPKALVVPMLLFKINENLGHYSHSVICETQIPRLYVISPKLTLIYKVAQVSPDIFNILTCEVFQLLKDRVLG